MAEASSIIADAVTGTVILTLSNLAVPAGPSVLARACSVEAVAVVSDTVLALNQSTVAAVVARVAHTPTTSALPISMAVGQTTQTDGA